MSGTGRCATVNGTGERGRGRELPPDQATRARFENRWIHYDLAVDTFEDAAATDYFSVR